MFFLAFLSVFSSSLLPRRSTSNWDYPYGFDALNSILFSFQSVMKHDRSMAMKIHSIFLCANFDVIFLLVFIDVSKWLYSDSESLILLMSMEINSNYWMLIKPKGTVLFFWTHNIKISMTYLDSIDLSSNIDIEFFFRNFLPLANLFRIRRETPLKKLI